MNCFLIFSSFEVPFGSLWFNCSLIEIERKLFFIWIDFIHNSKFTIFFSFVFHIVTGPLRFLSPWKQKYCFGGILCRVFLKKIYTSFWVIYRYVICDQLLKKKFLLVLGPGTTFCVAILGAQDFAILSLSVFYISGMDLGCVCPTTWLGMCTGTPDFFSVFSLFFALLRDANWVHKLKTSQERAHCLLVF
jgi:hypothetical protein